MNRRGFLTGLLASVAIPTLAPSGIYAVPPAIALGREMVLPAGPPEQRAIEQIANGFQ